MAKEFKEYDKKYRHLMGKLLDGETWPASLEVWPHMDILVKDNITTVQRAVYSEKGAEEWQKFRVSLKGWSTQHKLGRLQTRLVNKARGPNDTEYYWELVRINNYIDSMKRGGLINTDGIVIK